MRVAADTYCRFEESEFTRDAELRAALSGGIRAGTLAAACLQIKRNEKSPVARLPSEAGLFLSGGQELHDIRKAADLICGFDHAVLSDCIGRLNGTPLLLEVSGGFTALMSATGSDFLLCQVIRSEAEIAAAIDRIHSHTAELIRQAALSGVRIFSFADPSAMPEVIGKKLWLRYSVEAACRLFRLVDPFLDHAVLHICPRTSAGLAGRRLCTCERCPDNRESLLENLLELSGRGDVHFTGHICIHADRCAQNELRIVRLNPQGLRYENID